MTRVPLNLFAIAFGLSGLAGTWTTAAAAGLAPGLVGDLIWVAAFVAWVVTIVRSGGRKALAADLRHPVLGPFGALVPVVGLLISARVISFWPVPGRIGVGVFLAAATVFAGWFVAHLVRGNLDVDALHPGYLLPTVAAGLIGGMTAAVAGWTTVAVASFAVGILFWALSGAVLLGRLALRPPLPAGIMPTMAIFAAPPAVAGNAWLAINGGRLDLTGHLLLGTMVVLVLMQVFLLPSYAKLTFALGFWAFTFTTAASATYGLHWLAITAPPAWRLWSWLILAVATAVIGGIAVASVRLTLHQARSRKPTPDPAATLQKA